MDKLLDGSLQVNEFGSRYNFHFWTNTLGKGMNPFITQAIG